MKNIKKYNEFLNESNTFKIEFVLSNWFYDTFNIDNSDCDKYAKDLLKRMHDNGTKIELVLSDWFYDTFSIDYGKLGESECDKYVKDLLKRI